MRLSLKIVMIENIIETANSSQEEIRTDVLVWEKTSGRFRKWTNNLIIINTCVEYNVWYEIWL